MLRPQIFLLILGLIFAVFTVSVVAKPGDSCTTPQGSGKCMKTSECRGSMFTPFPFQQLRDASFFLPLSLSPFLPLLHYFPMDTKHT